MQTEAQHPLKGVQIVDLTSMIVGPVCTVRLADYGAEVIKMEPPEGDLMRSLGGPSPSGTNSGSFIHCNRGKRMVCLDLKVPAARAALDELMVGADVFVSNMRPAALERLGLGATTLRARKPGLIHCTISGFGPDGPYRGLPAYDTVLQGASGLAGLFGRRDGTPMYVPMMICDHVVGEIAAGAILSALYARSATGAGSTIEIPMFETMAAFVLQEHLGPHTFDPPIGPIGDSRVLSAANAPLATADGWISVTTNTDAQTHAFLRALGRADMVDDARFRTTADRFKNAEAWFGWRKTALFSRPTAEWMDIFKMADVPAMPCHSLDSLLEDPHLKAVSFWQQAIHPLEGRVNGLRPTVIHDGFTSAAAAPSNPLGWDTRAVLAQAGLSERAIEDLVASRAAIDGRAGASVVTEVPA